MHRCRRRSSTSCSVLVGKELASLGNEQPAAAFLPSTQATGEPPITNPTSAPLAAAAHFRRDAIAEAERRTRAGSYVVDSHGTNLHSEWRFEANASTHTDTRVQGTSYPPYFFVPPLPPPPRPPPRLPFSLYVSSHACTRTRTRSPDPQLDDVKERQLSSRQLLSRQKSFTPVAVSDSDHSLYIIKGPNQVARDNLPGDDRRKISPMHGGFVSAPTAQR